MALTDLQERFVAYYADPDHPAYGNATQAYMYAYGVEPSSAETAGPRLLGNVRVRQAIDRELRKAGLRAQAILDRLAAQATADIGDVAELYGLDPEQARVKLKELRRKGKTVAVRRLVPTRHGVGIELYDAQRALELLAKMSGLLTERVRLDTSVDLESLSDDEFADLERQYVQRKRKGLRTVG